VGLTSKTKVGRFKVPTWALIVLNVVALFGGIMLGSGALDILFAEPETRARISAIQPGQQKTAMIEWPVGNFTGGQLSMVLDVGVNTTIADDVIVTIELLDPEDQSRTYTVAKVDTFDVKRGDGLVYASKNVNLIPLLTNMRGVVRDFKARQVPLRARVDRKVPTSTVSGLVFVTSANVIGKPVSQPL
jgi:hypothetical protein